MSGSRVLKKELGITITLIIYYELSEFQAGRWILVRSKDRVESRSSVTCVRTSVFVTAAWCPFVLLGGLAHEHSAEQNSRQEHVQSCPVSSSPVFTRQIQI